MRREYLQERLLFFAPLSEDTQDKVSGQYGVVGSKASVTLDSTRRAHLISPKSYYSAVTDDTNETGLGYDLSHLNLPSKDYTVMARCEATVLCKYSNEWIFQVALQSYPGAADAIHINSHPVLDGKKSEVGKLYKFAWRIKDAADMYYNGTLTYWRGRMAGAHEKNLSIGATYDGREAYHSEAYISDFRIYDGVLTPEEIEAIWEGGY